MQKHTKIYLNYFDYGQEDFIPCEACGSKAIDIHHINGRGKNKNTIQNLCALYRRCHALAHSKLSKGDIQLIHNYFLNGHRKIFIK